MPRKPRRGGYTPPVTPQRPMRQAAKILPPPQRESDEYDDEPAPKKRGSNGMSDDTFAAVVRSAIDAGSNYDQDQLQSDRLRAWRFYKGDMSEDLAPNDNGSSVVSYDVRDMVHTVIPSLERVFFTVDDAIVFEAQTASDAAWVELANAYVTYLVRDRLGVIGLRCALMDAAMAKVGNVAWYWDQSERVKTEKYTNLSDDAYALATEPPDDKTTVEIIEETRHQIPPDPIETEVALAMRQQGQQVPLPAPIEVRDCLIRYTSKTERLCIEAFPPEERIMDPRARTPETARFRGRRMVKLVYELVEMGYDRDEVLEHATIDAETDPALSQDAAVRQPAGFVEIGDDIPDDDYRQVAYCELWIYADRDGDGVAELVKVCTIGDEFHVVHEEAADQVQIAEFQIMPLPHTVSGRSLADNLTDVQMIKTGCWRGVMESLPHSIYPRIWGVEGRVNWDDILDNSPGQPIRVKDASSIGQFKVDFVGEAAIEVMQYVDNEVRDQRTGVSKAAQGLDPDALQSTPKEAAAAMIGATQTQIEDYARMLGETGFRALYRGLLREIVTHQRDPDWMQLNNEWVQVDPRPWNAELNVRVDVAGGTHNASQKLVALTQIAAAQQTAMQSLGPDNPLVSLAEIYNAQTDIAKLAGFRNASRYWKDPAKMPGWKPQPPPGQADQTAEQAQAIAKAEVEKAQIKDDTDRYKLQLEDDRERDRNEAQVMLDAVKVAGPSGLEIGMRLVEMMRMPRPPSTLPAPPNPHNPPPGMPPPQGLQGPMPQ